MSAPTATAVFAHQPRALPRPARGHKLAPSPREIDCLSCLIVLRGQRLGYLRHSALMESPSPTHAELAAAMSCDESTARKHVHALARKGSLAAAGQARVAALIGVDDSTITRIKDGQLERLAAVLAASGLKVVPEDHQTLAPEYVRALQVLAVRGVENAPAPSGFGELPTS